MNTTSTLNPDLVAYCEAYEAFVDEYCDFMERYLANPYDYNLISEYSSIVERSNEFAQAAENYDTTNLTTEELAYFTEVINRCNSRMMSAVYN